MQAAQGILTLRFDSADGSEILLKADPELAIQPRVAGVLADLYDESGRAIEKGRSIFDWRHQEAGTYYLRVFHPGSADDRGDTPSLDASLSFQITAEIPFDGVAHQESDRDKIRGGEGNDISLMVG